MICEVAICCLTALALYAMRLHELHARERLEIEARKSYADAALVQNALNQVAEMRRILDETSKRIDHESGRISGLAMRK